MTASIDRFWVSLGVDHDELIALKARRIAYAGMVTIVGLSTCLLAGIVSNLVGGVA